MTNITTLRPGEHFMFKDFEWVCLDPNPCGLRQSGLTVGMFAENTNTNAPLATKQSGAPAKRE